MDGHTPHFVLGSLDWDMPVRVKSGQGNCELGQCCDVATYSSAVNERLSQGAKEDEREINHCNSSECS